MIRLCSGFMDRVEAWVPDGESLDGIIYGVLSPGEFAESSINIIALIYSFVECEKCAYTVLGPSPRFRRLIRSIFLIISLIP